jgi:hypothetical protein
LRCPETTSEGSFASFDGETPNNDSFSFSHASGGCISTSRCLSIDRMGGTARSFRRVGREPGAGAVARQWIARTGLDPGAA